MSQFHKNPRSSPSSTAPGRAAKSACRSSGQSSTGATFSRFASAGKPPKGNGNGQLPSRARPASAGRRYRSKARDLRDVGEALIAAAKDASKERLGQPQARPRVKDAPARAAERAKFDQENAARRPAEDADLPF